MTLNDKDKRSHIKALQSLQRDINFLEKAKENNPSIETTIDILRNSQDRLYSALAQHGITAEDVYKVIMENADKQIVKEIMQLQKAKDNAKNHLATPRLTPEKRQSLEHRLTQATQQHRAKWDEIINNPDKDRIIAKIEQAQLKELQKEERQRDKTRDYDRTR